MGLVGRQESGLEHGERLLAFANEYRKLHPETLLSEIDDMLRNADTIADDEAVMRGLTTANGNGALPPVKPEDVLDTLDQHGDVHRYRI